MTIQNLSIFLSVEFACSIGFIWHYSVFLRQIKAKASKASDAQADQSQFNRGLIATAPSISIIIPVRNEAQQIEALLQNLMQQDYPRAAFEIIVSDDHSTDQTALVVKQFIGANTESNPHVHWIEADSKGKVSFGKKNALQTAIAQAKGEWIFVTDADTAPSQHWLSKAVAYLRQNPCDLLLATVQFEEPRQPNKNSDLPVLQIMQKIEQDALMAFAAAYWLDGNPILCNGANMMYKKNKFHEVGGYHGLLHISSGDDTLLLERMSAQHATIGFQCNNAVKIPYENNVPAYLNQRVRWLSKSKFIQNKSAHRLTLYLGLVNLWPLLICLLTCLVLATNQLHKSTALRTSALTAVELLLYWVAKARADIRLGRNKRQIKSPPYPIVKVWWAEICYAFVIGYLALRTLRPGFTWKGRKVHQSKW